MTLVLKENTTLYHGTSKWRLHAIMAENRLRGFSIDIPAVSTSDKIEPALYWANRTAWLDTSDPVLIRLNSDKLLAKQYVLDRYSDPIFGEGKCDWESEIRVSGIIFPLDEVMESYEEVPWNDLRRNCPLQITRYTLRGKSYRQQPENETPQRTSKLQLLEQRGQ